MAHLEVWDLHGHTIVTLGGERLSVGKSADCDLALADGAASRVHAVFEHVGGAWCITDLGSRNGTLVNGLRIFRIQRLRSGDEVTVGKTRLVFQDRATADETSTDVIDPPPRLTAKEHEVLLELCRPLLLGDVFVQPAAVHDIAQAMFVTDGAVKAHLSRLYDKFGIFGDEAVAKRVRLANAAIRSGAVAVADLRKTAAT